MHTTRLLPLLVLLHTSLIPVVGWGADPVKETPVDTTYLRKHAETRGFMIGRPVHPRPTPDGKSVLFLRAKPPDPKLALFEFDVASGKTRQLLTPEAVLNGSEEKLSAEEKARRERMRVASGGFTDFQHGRGGQAGAAGGSRGGYSSSTGTAARYSRSPRAPGHYSIRNSVRTAALLPTSSTSMSTSTTSRRTRNTALQRGVRRRKRTGSPSSWPRRR